MPESHEYLPQNSDDMERLLAIDRLIESYFPDDTQFVLEQLRDEEDVVSFLYGQLLEIGEDPEEVLLRYGITEESDEI
jgi:hypothetical protein